MKQPTGRCWDKHGPAFFVTGAREVAAVLLVVVHRTEKRSVRQDVRVVE